MGSKKLLFILDNIVLFFGDFRGGGFLIWRWPEYPVFVDGRIVTWKEGGLYPFWEEEQVIRLGPGWEKILAKYEVSWAVIPANPYLAGGREHDLASALRQRGWEEVDRDDFASILVEEQLWIG